MDERRRFIEKVTMWLLFSSIIILAIALLLPGGDFVLTGSLILRYIGVMLFSFFIAGIWVIREREMLISEYRTGQRSPDDDTN
jgi:hypothetical protein